VGCTILKTVFFRKCTNMLSTSQARVISLPGYEVDML
jgi:hypothetical protein